MVYNRSATPLLKLAHSRGIPSSAPGDVCAAGRAPVRNLDGQAAPEAEMQRVVELALRKRP